MYSGIMILFRFTIQNVSIKWVKLLKDYSVIINLQYKMFLLNYHQYIYHQYDILHLQYKMFLLNINT